LGYAFDLFPNSNPETPYPSLSTSRCKRSVNAHRAARFASVSCEAPNPVVSRKSTLTECGFMSPVLKAAASIGDSERASTDVILAWSTGVPNVTVSLAPGRGRKRGKLRGSGMMSLKPEIHMGITVGRWFTSMIIRAVPHLNRGRRAWIPSDEGTTGYVSG